MFVRAWLLSGEEVDEQLVHALGLVVVDPVGRVGQALDPVEVGHVLVVRLGELGAEVAIALPPDDQGGRRDGAKLALLRRQPHRGAVVVDHRLRRPWLGPRVDVAIDLLRRVRRAGVAQEALEEPPVPAARTALGQPRELEVEEVPGPQELTRVAQSFVQPPRMGRVQDDEAVDDLRVVRRQGPRDGAAPVVTDHHRGLGTELADEAADVAGELVGGVGGVAVRPRRQVVAAQVGRDDAEARLHERCDLLPPAVPELREAVQQDDQWPVAGLDVVQLHVADLGVALAKAGVGVRRRAGEAYRVSWWS